MNKEIKPVIIVTIKNKLPLFKKEEAAKATELIELEEVGYELVAQKDLYEVGQKAVLVLPDYNVSDIELFDSFIRPNGDESKSMLGKVEGKPRRIRAKKFNLSKEPNGLPVYSNGILLSLNEVGVYLADNNKSVDITKLTELLGITKYEEPEYRSGSSLKTMGSTSFPQGLYKTDEENINNLWNSIKYPIRLIGSEKIDGSSITIGITPEIPEGFICSRNMRKKLTVKKHTGRRKKTFWERLLFWTNPDLNLYTEVQSEDDFVRYGLPYLNLLKYHGITNLILRGELNGSHLKGSGNKNNPASKVQPNIQFFGADTIQNGVAVKCNFTDSSIVTQSLDVPRVKVVFDKTFNSKEELLEACNNYFSKNMIEGIVVRTVDSKFSAKIMNLEYDSKK